ncbi:MAG: DUF177 domain-containing protein [Oscillospiraceae bacterium]|nr:DUF177 domain-containing protein [Oscillospiraceae bacterium]
MHEQQNTPDYLISVKPLLYRAGEKKELSVTIDAETAAQYGLECQTLPTIQGMLENQAGVLFLRYHVSCIPALECDRCLSPVTTPIEEDFSHVVVTQTASEQNDSEYLLASDAMLDLAEAVMTDLRLSLPTKTLCSPDCKGLCPMCGCNRNESECSCDSEDVTQNF